MTTVKPNSISSQSVNAIFDFARGLLGARKADVQPVFEEPRHVPSAVMGGINPDHSRYARLLEKELDRQHLTAVEREDTDMLDRVRSALYST